MIGRRPTVFESLMIENVLQFRYPRIIFEIVVHHILSFDTNSFEAQIEIRSSVKNKQYIDFRRVKYKRGSNDQVSFH